MKKISELGLEAIELRDKVLLVNRETINLGDYDFENGKIKIFGYYSKSVVKKVISSSKPLEGLPLLVIEDEVDDHEIFMIKAGVSRDDIINWKKGYSRAKETYKFTEEDLVRAMDMARKRDVDGCIEFEDEDIIQSLTKKELWVEVEYKDLTGRWYPVDKFIDITNQHFEPLGLRPKIENNTIRAVWK